VLLNDDDDDDDCVEVFNIDWTPFIAFIIIVIMTRRHIIALIEVNYFKNFTTAVSA